MHKLTFYFWSPHYLHFSALVTGMSQGDVTLNQQLTYPLQTSSKYSKTESG